MGPEFGGPARDFGVARENVVARDAVFTPSAALRVVIAQQRLQTVNGRSEPCLWRFLGLELLPQGTHFRLLVGGQEAEDAVGRAFLALPFADLRRRVVDEGIPGVNFHEVVDEDHLEDTREVHGLVGVLGEDHGHHGKVVHVLGVVLAALGVRDDAVAAQDGFGLVNFHEEVDLPGKAFGQEAGGRGAGRVHGRL